MKTYAILVTRTAEKSLASLPKKERLTIIGLIENLSHNPFPQGCKKLNGEENTFRIRAGNYRVIYEIQGKQLIILVLKIGHRKDINR